MTKRQKLIAYWLACMGGDTIVNVRRGRPPSRTDWDGFAVDGDDPEPSIQEIEEVLSLMSKDYHASP